MMRDSLRKLTVIPALVRNYMSSSRRRSAIVFLSVVLLSVSSVALYKLGAHNAINSRAVSITVTSPGSYIDDKKQSDPNNSRVYNSGFLKLNGKVVEVSSSELVIKLMAGNEVSLYIKPGTKYYSHDKSAHLVDELKEGLSVTVIGTIESNGTFVASNIKVE